VTEPRLYRTPDGALWARAPRKQRRGLVSVQHVHPFGDLIEHDTDTEDCVCGPTAHRVTAADGTDRWLLVHHSLDGREHQERRQ